MRGTLSKIEEDRIQLIDKIEHFLKNQDHNSLCDIEFLIENKQKIMTLLASGYYLFSKSVNGEEIC